MLVDCEWPSKHSPLEESLRLKQGEWRYIAKVAAGLDEAGYDGVIDESVRLREGILADLDGHELLDQGTQSKDELRDLAWVDDCRSLDGRLSHFGAPPRIEQERIEG